MREVSYRPKSQVFSILAVTIGSVGILFVLYLARHLALAVLIGIGLGVLMAPLMNLMQRRFRIPRGLSAIVMVLLILGSVAAVGYGLVALLAEQVESFVASLPQISATIQSESEKLFRNYPWIREQVAHLNVGKATQTAASTLFMGVQTLAHSFAGFVLVLTLGVFTAINSSSYLSGILSLFPAYRRPKAASVLQCSAEMLRKWFRSQALIVAISASLTTFGLWMLGIDYWLLIGVLAFVLGFIPYIGSFLTLFVAAAVTLGSTPGKIGWVVAIYLIIQQIEGNVSTPLVMRESAQLPEVHVVAFMLIMGSLFGILGVFAASPLLAVLRTIYVMTYVPAMDAQVVAPAEAQAEVAPARRSA